MKHPALGRLHHVADADVSSLDDLERAVRRRPMRIGVLSDEELVLTDDAAITPADTPRLAAYDAGGQDAALAAAIAMLRARGELEVDGDHVALRGRHAAVTAMREQVTDRVRLVELPPGPDAWHVTIDRVGARDLAMVRVIEPAAGIHMVTASRLDHAGVWALRGIGVIPRGRDGRAHPRRQQVRRAVDPNDLDPSLHRLEAEADTVLAVGASLHEACTGAMTITSGPAGVHLHRGFTTRSGEEHTVTHLDPIHLGELLSSLLVRDGHPGSGGSR